MSETMRRWTLWLRPWLWRALWFDRKVRVRWERERGVRPGSVPVLPPEDTITLAHIYQVAGHLEAARGRASVMAFVDLEDWLRPKSVLGPRDHSRTPPEEG